MQRGRSPYSIDVDALNEIGTEELESNSVADTSKVVDIRGGQPITWQEVIAAISIAPTERSADGYLSPISSVIPQCGHYDLDRQRCERDAAYWYIAPDGTLCPGMPECVEHALATITEYEEKLGERWSLEPVRLSESEIDLVSSLVAFGSWGCNCTMLASTYQEIPSKCPKHGKGLLGPIEWIENLENVSLGYSIADDHSVIA